MMTAPIEDVNRGTMDDQLAAALDDVARATGIPHAAILSRSRWSEQVAARHKFWHTLHRRGWAYAAIARYVGVHHTTVMAAVRKAAR